MQSLRIFCDVATHRSFSQAAARHGITQSAASQRVSQLEKRLGVTLIDRSVRPLALTAAGDEFLRGCKELVERYDRLEQRVSRHRRQPEGEVRVDAIYSAGIDLLNRIQEAFEREHPQVRVRVSYKRPEQVYEAVRAQQCDLGILSYPQRWREVGVLPLRNERMVVVCAPRHALAHRRRVQAAELDAWPMVGFELGLPAGRRVRRYLREHHASPRVTSRFDNVDTIKSAVAVTNQLAILPKRTVLREVRAGTLAAMELEPELLRPLGVIFYRPRYSYKTAFTPAAQAFVDFLLANAGPNVGDGEVEALPGVAGGETASGSPGTGAGEGNSAEAGESVIRSAHLVGEKS